MKFIGAIGGGAIGGIVGALLWAGIAILFQVEIAWLALGVGLLVGMGVSFGAKTEGWVPACIAVVLTLASIAGGKYLTVKYFMMGSAAQLEGMFEFTGERAVATLISEMPAEEAARFANLPPVDPANLEDDDIPNNFHPKIWAWGQVKWSEMSDDEQVAFTDKHSSQIQEAVSKIQSEAEAEGFWAAWDGMDFLFLGLAAFTAFSIGKNDPMNDDE